MQVIEVTGYAVRSAVITMRCSDSPLCFALYPMMHVATPAFYRQVATRLAGCDLIVAEGIRGRSWQVSTLTMAYRFAPRRARNGLQLQDYKQLLPAGVPVLNPDVTGAEAAAQLRILPRWMRWTLLLAAPAFGLVFAVRGPRAFLDEDLVVEDLPSTHRAERMVDERVEEALGGQRDRQLLDALSSIHAERHDEAITVAVVYGAGHVPAIAAGLRERHGYRPRDAEWLTVYIPG
ncbi:MAG TPA: hypothetical protein VL551_04990 [Actinospica sp.]|jgi:hypothetical protein|nr:hypothetical protein [Actinospica sp.]